MADVCVLAPDAWLAGYLGGEVFRLTLSGEPGQPTDLDPVRQCQQRPAPVFLYTRIPAAWLNAVRMLEELGFHLVETSVVFDKTCDSAAPCGGVCVRPARPDDRQAVVELARQSFVFSRFHLDPAIPRKDADAVKAGWAESYFLGKRGDGMIVATAGETVVGFLQLLFAGTDGMVIDLIAVDREHRGMSVAAAMIAQAQRLPGRTLIRVGTQAVNMPSVRLYEKLGFRLRESSYVFHYHNAMRLRAMP
jgi:ribosomal protein S18 acetylase RimI-like enzyme